jgi:hypothetical protein
MATQVYFFNASLNTPAGTPIDASSAWVSDTIPFTGQLALNFNAQSDATLGSISSKFLHAKGTSAPSSGPAILSVVSRMWGTRISSGAVASATIFTAGLAENLGTVVGPFTNPAIVSGALVTLTPPTGGWTWTNLSTLEVKVFDSSGDGSLSATFGKIDLVVTVAPRNLTGNYGPQLAVSEGMSRSEVLN